MNSDRIEEIEKHGKTARGKGELLKHLHGEKLTIRQATQAHCYDCMGYFADGKNDCEMPRCSLYPYMPYNRNRVKRLTGRTLTEEHKSKLRGGRQG